MKTKSKRKRWNPKVHSRYKMVVYFKNKGSSSTFYSFDWKSGYSKFLDPQKGLKGLHKKVKEYGMSARCILIYDRTTDTLIEKYFEGTPVALED